MGSGCALSLSFAELVYISESALEVGALASCAQLLSMCSAATSPRTQLGAEELMQSKYRCKTQGKANAITRFSMALPYQDVSWLWCSRAGSASSAESCDKLDFQSV